MVSYAFAPARRSRYGDTGAIGTLSIRALPVASGMLRYRYGARLRAGTHFGVQAREYGMYSFIGIVSFQLQLGIID